MKKETLLKKLGTFKKVNHIEKNQIEIVFEKGVILQSYDSIVAVRLKTDGILYLGTNYNYNLKTSKYLEQFCGYSSKECTIKLGLKDPNFKLIKY